MFTFQALATGDTFVYMIYEKILPEQPPEELDEKVFVIHVE